MLKTSTLASNSLVVVKQTSQPPPQLLIQIIMVKTQGMIWEQYKRLLRKAFPKLTFRDSTWNWHKVYSEDPCENKTFLRIYNAYKHVSEKNKVV